MILILLISLAACAHPRVHVYDGHTRIIAQRNLVDRKCLKSGDLWDNGTPVKPGESAAACWIRDAREMWIQDSCIGAKAAAIHEPCHMDCDKFVGDQEKLDACDDACDKVHFEEK